MNKCWRCIFIAVVMQPSSRYGKVHLNNLAKFFQFQYTHWLGFKSWVTDTDWYRLIQTELLIPLQTCASGVHLKKKTMDNYVGLAKMNIIQITGIWNTLLLSPNVLLPAHINFLLATNYGMYQDYTEVQMVSSRKFRQIKSVSKKKSVTQTWYPAECISKEGVSSVFATLSKGSNCTIYQILASSLSGLFWPSILCLARADRKSVV